MLQVKHNRSAEEVVAVLQKVKDQIQCFTSTVEVQRFEELMRLKDYLDYRVRLREYEASIAAANGNADKLRAKYVEAKLAKFDEAEKIRAEQEKWGWSPLFRIFKEWPLPNFPTSPWAHTHEEWAAMETALLAQFSAEPLSLELECPHIVRAFLMLFRTLHGHSRPLPHPDASLTLDYILDFAVDNDKSVALTNVVHNLAITGWASFPGIKSALDSYSNLHSDTVALLGYEPNKQVAVVEKIRTFIGRVAHRVVCDMVRMQRARELEDMWFACDVPEQRRTRCDEVRILVIQMITFLLCLANYFVVQFR